MTNQLICILLFFPFSTFSWNVSNSPNFNVTNKDPIENIDENDNSLNIKLVNDTVKKHYEIGENHTKIIDFNYLSPLVIRNTTELPQIAVINNFNFIFNHSSLTDNLIRGAQDFVSLESGVIIVLKGNQTLEKHMQPATDSSISFIDISLPNESHFDPTSRLYICKDRKVNPSHIFTIGDSYISFNIFSQISERFTLELSFKSKSRKILCTNTQLFILHENGILDILDYGIKGQNGYFEHFSTHSFATESLAESVIDFDIDYSTQTLFLLFQSEYNFLKSYRIIDKTLQLSGIVIPVPSGVRVYCTSDSYLYLITKRVSYHSIMEYQLDGDRTHAILNREFETLFHPTSFVCNSKIFIAFSVGQIFLGRRRVPAKLIMNNQVGKSVLTTDMFGFNWAKVMLGVLSNSSFTVTGYSDNGYLNFYKFFLEFPNLQLNGNKELKSKDNFEVKIEIISQDCSWGFSSLAEKDGKYIGCIYSQSLEIEYYTDKPSNEKLSWVLGFAVGLFSLAFISASMLFMVKRSFNTKANERETALKTLAKQYELVDESNSELPGLGNYSEVFTDPSGISHINSD